MGSCACSSRNPFTCTHRTAAGSPACTHDLRTAPRSVLAACLCACPAPHSLQGHGHAPGTHVLGQALLVVGPAQSEVARRDHFAHVGLHVLVVQDIHAEVVPVGFKGVDGAAGRQVAGVGRQARAQAGAAMSEANGAQGLPTAALELIGRAFLLRRRC